MKDEIIPIKKEEEPKIESSDPFFTNDGNKPKEREDLKALYRRIIPVSVALVGRSVKFRDVFTLSGAVYVTSTPVTVSTDVQTTTETNLASFLFFKDEWHVGMTVRINALGTYTSDGTRTMTLRIGGGTAPTTEWNSATSTAASTTNAPWNIEWYGIITTIGSSGTLEAQMKANINRVNKDDSNSSAVAIDTTSNLMIPLTAEWSASTAGNSVTVRQFIVEILN